MESNPANSLTSPTENSIAPPSEKRQKILSDKDGDQCADDGHSFECAFQVVPYKDGKSYRGQDEQGENLLSLVPPKPPKRESICIGAYAAQCAKCCKWRLVPTKEKYEELRERILEDPFACEKAREWKPDVTCDEPSDVSPDGRRLWAIDKPNIAQAPPGWERLIRIRGEGSTRFADVYYSSPTGKKMRSKVEVEKYLAENPQQGVKLSQFSFKIPAPLQQGYVKKRPRTSQNDGTHTGSTKPLQPEEVQPISWAASLTHGDPGDNKQLVLYKEDQPELIQSELRETKPGSPPQPSAV